MFFTPIDSMPGFTEHLGKARTARIRYAQKGTAKRQPAAANIINDIIQDMQCEELSDVSPVSDILSGIANAGEDMTQKPLSVLRLYTILQCMPIINSREVGLMMSISPRHAQRYVKAIKVAIPFIKLALAHRKRKKESNREHETQAPDCPPQEDL